MEASLLPSKAIRAFAKQVVLAVVKRDDTACAALRKEFAIPFLNSWVVVLDGKGETLASWVGDAAGAQCDKRSVHKFPRNLVRLARQMLKRTETLQELLRQWEGRPGDTKLFETLSRRLSEMHGYGRLRQLCEDAAKNPKLSEVQRHGFRIQAFTARASDHSEKLATRMARARFARLGEKLLVELAGHPQAGDLVDAVFYRGYAHDFDVPTRSAQALARLERACRAKADAAPLRERIRELTRVREDWIAATKESLGEIKDTHTKEYLAAALGDARAAIKLCSRRPYRDNPEYREWLREAQRKVERESKPARARGLNLR